MHKDLQMERVKIFEDTMKLCETDKRLADAVSFSRQNQQVIAENAEISEMKTGYEMPAKVLVSQKRSLEAAKQYRDQKVCVLNFASATNAGGGITKGSNAQEEAICRCSTLYPCISDEKVTSRFHDKHRSTLRSGQLTALYNDDCIYTPGVIVFKSDTDQPQLLSERLWYKVDVISCAALNLRSRPGNAMNPDSGSRAVSIKPDELMAIHKKRISRILDIAGWHGAEVVILGAFGCGAFQNPPDVTAKAMYEVIQNYLYQFRAIEFAVYCPPKDTRNLGGFSEGDNSGNEIERMKAWREEVDGKINKC